MREADDRSSTQAPILALRQRDERLDRALQRRLAQRNGRTHGHRPLAVPQRLHERLDGELAPAAAERDRRGFAHACVGRRAEHFREHAQHRIVLHGVAQLLQRDESNAHVLVLEGQLACLLEDGLEIERASGVERSRAHIGFRMAQALLDRELGRSLRVRDRRECAREPHGPSRHRRRLSGQGFQQLLGLRRVDACDRGHRPQQSALDHVAEVRGHKACLAER